MSETQEVKPPMQIPAKFGSITQFKRFYEDDRVKARMGNLMRETGMSPDRFIGIVVNSVTKTPKLLTCTGQSIWNEVMKAAEAGLEINTPTDEGYLIPFWDKKVKSNVATFITGYKGLIKLATQHPDIRALKPVLIYRNDFFEHEEGTKPVFIHRPVALDKPRGDMMGVYVQVYYKDEEFPVVYGPYGREEIMQHKAASAAGESNFSPWNRPETEPSMWLKTGIRITAKFLPKVTRMAKLLDNTKAEEYDAELLDDFVVIDDQEESANIEKKIQEAEVTEEENAAGKVDLKTGELTLENPRAGLVTDA